MLQGDEGILQSKKKFQKRPALKRTYPLEVIEEEGGNFSTKPLTLRNQRNEIVSEQENHSEDDEEN